MLSLPFKTDYALEFEGYPYFSGVDLVLTVIFERDEKIDVESVTLSGPNTLSITGSYTYSLANRNLISFSLFFRRSSSGFVYPNAYYNFRAYFRPINSTHRQQFTTGIVQQFAPFSWPVSQGVRSGIELPQICTGPAEASGGEHTNWSNGDGFLKIKSLSGLFTASAVVANRYIRFQFLDNFDHVLYQTIIDAAITANEVWRYSFATTSHNFANTITQIGSASIPEVWLTFNTVVFIDALNYQVGDVFSTAYGCWERINQSSQINP
jgi:hypothetical protein